MSGVHGAVVSRRRILPVVRSRAQPLGGSAAAHDQMSWVPRRDAWIRVGDVDLLECANCDGTWIETAAFDRLCTQREQQAAIAQADRGTEEPGAGGAGSSRSATAPARSAER